MILTACGSGHASISGDAAPVDGASTQDGAGSASTGVYVIDETFNEMTTGAVPNSPWTIESSSAGSVAVREVPFAVDKSIEIAKPDASGTSSLAVAFAAQSGRVVFEAKVKALETAGFKAIPYIYDAAATRSHRSRFRTAISTRDIGARSRP